MEYITLKPVIILISTFIIYMIYFYGIDLFTAWNKIIISLAWCQFVFRLRYIMSRFFSLIYLNIWFFVLWIRCIIPAKILEIIRLLSRIFINTAKIYLCYPIIVILCSATVYFFYITISYWLSSSHNR